MSVTSLFILRFILSFILSFSFSFTPSSTASSTASFIGLFGYIYKYYYIYGMKNPSEFKSDKYYCGYFYPENREKVINEHVPIKYRSSLERRFMIYCDRSPNIKKWGYEVVYIPYYDLLKNKKRIYFIDFYIIDSNDNKILIEVKHTKQLKKPVLNESKKNSYRYLKNYEASLKEYLVNLEKWKFAKKYAETHNMKFFILNEKNINKLAM